MINHNITSRQNGSKPRQKVINRRITTKPHTGPKNKLARNHYPYHISSYHKQVQCDSPLRHPPVRPPNPEQQPHNTAFSFFFLISSTKLQLVYNLKRKRSRNSVRSVTKIHPACRADVGMNVQSIAHAGRKRIASQPHHAAAQSVGFVPLVKTASDAGNGD